MPFPQKDPDGIPCHIKVSQAPISQQETSKLVASFQPEASSCELKTKNDEHHFSAICLTLPETNIAPENGWLEDDPFLLGQTAYFQVRSVSFREGIPFKHYFGQIQIVLVQSWVF